VRTARSTHAGDSRGASNARHVAPHSSLRRVLTALGVVICLLFVTGTASAIVAYYKLNGNITKDDVTGLLNKDRPAKVDNPNAPQEPENILLIGSDKRATKYQNADNIGQRSDTTILLHLSADRKSAVLVSIPRDTIVDIPTCKRRDGTTFPPHPGAMFNSAFSEAGAACTINVVEKLTKIRIDHHVVIDFGGFRDMVNALGGVKICLPEAVADPDSHLFLSKGEHVVHGKDALAYVRTRHGLGNGSDIERITRQQAFLGSMVTKIKSKGLLLRPDRLLSFLGAATHSISADPALGNLNALRKLAEDVKNMDSKNITFLTAPNEPYPADPNRVQLKPSAAGVWHALRYDQPLPGTKPKPTSTPSPTATGPALKTPPANIRVQVLNGSTTKGEASRVAKDLRAEGFQVVGVGNAARRDYTQTKVMYDPAYDESGRTLGAALTGSKTTADATLGSTLVVIVGSDAPAVTQVVVPDQTASPPAVEKLQTRNATSNICS
jgi:LCP family protein required for cell wall assembly